MKFYYPAYYHDFACLASSCPDTCCAAWEIVIDEETLSFYRSLNGEISDNIRSALAVDDEGDSIFRLQNGRCPFLNEEGLCDIHIKLGEEHTSEICRQHPRFTEEYDGFTEISLSASCPAANDLIFDSVLTPDTYPVPESDGEDELLSMLISSRSKLIRELCDLNDPDSAVRMILEESKKTESAYLGYSCDYYDFDPKTYTAEYLKFLSDEAEILTDDWKRYLGIANASVFDTKKMSELYAEQKEDINKAFAYFLYRTYLKAVNDEYVYLRGLFIVLSVLCCMHISAGCSLSFNETIRLYSKEIEHDPENLDRIREYLHAVSEDN